MTEWFHKSPGSDIGPSRDVEGMSLIGLDNPDWINVPDHPGLPGGKRRVLSVVQGTCCRPGHDHPASHYMLEGPVSCCECLIDNVFQWYKKKLDMTDENH